MLLTNEPDEIRSRRGLTYARQAPTFVSRDPDHGVVDAWVPSATLGAGFVF